MEDCKLISVKMFANLRLNDKESVYLCLLWSRNGKMMIRNDCLRLRLFDSCVSKTSIQKKLRLSFYVYLFCDLIMIHDTFYLLV